MLHKIVFMVLFVQTVKNVVFSTTTSESKTCLDLIKAGGNIACEITGEGNYEGMSISNCWISCRNGSNRFLLPHRSCERILEPDYWATYQMINHKLPPYGFEDCDETQKKRLQDWVDEWQIYKAKAQTTLCKG
uniref:Putative ixodes 10 kDa peptide protein n=1 Tax=Ixodes ricinus TaxID=34613 RepID=A0A0K8RAQ5_IXORI